MVVWDSIILNPILNFLIILSNALFHNFGLAIIVLTIIVRLLMLPLTLKQLRATKVMADLGPKMEALKKKYGTDTARLNQETVKLYRESGMNPAGCILPMLIQLPIWIALYQAINTAITLTPESIINLHGHLYSWSLIHQTIPLGEKFLWLNLGQPDAYYILPVITGVSMWVQQKMTTVHSSNPQQQMQNTMMLWTMPIMWGVITIWMPSGLALYWFVSNIIGIIIQYFVTGWGGLRGLGKSKDKSKKPVPVGPAIITRISDEPEEKSEEESEEKSKKPQVQTEGLTTDGKHRSERKDRTGSYRTRSKTTGSKTRRGRGYGNSRK